MSFGYIFGALGFDNPRADLDTAWDTPLEGVDVDEFQFELYRTGAQDEFVSVDNQRDGHIGYVFGINRYDRAIINIQVGSDSIVVFTRFPRLFITTSKSGLIF